MSRTSRFTMVSLATAVMIAGTVAFAQSTPSKDSKPAPAAPKATPQTPPGQGIKPGKAAPPASTDKTPAAPTAPGDMQLPPGVTEADMQACIAAGTPGEMHAKLTESVGVWAGKTSMWMAPGAEPIHGKCTSTVTSFMDGRFIKCEMSGDSAMGPFNGFGLYGYDNVGQTFQCTWVDNCSTAMMTGTGELSSDGKTMSWVYNYNCPITKKPTSMREVCTTTGKDSKTMEMYMTDPKSGKEFKMLEMTMTRQPGTATAVAPTN